MKIRNSFVSNSSSSSFLVFGKQPTECDSVLLNMNQKREVLHYVGAPDKLDLDVYLTEFISDAGDLHWDLPKKYGALGYCDGNHGGPYSEEAYDDISGKVWKSFSSGVWIRKDHNEKRKITDDSLPVNNAIALLEELLANYALGPHSLAAWAMDEEELIYETIRGLMYLEKELLEIENEESED